VHALHQLTVGDAGQCEEHVVAAHQVVDREHGVHRQPELLGLLALFVVARPQLALDIAAQALERRRRKHRLGRAADTHQHVRARIWQRGHDAARDVAIRGSA
jgi:hypothetical protein